MFSFSRQKIFEQINTLSFNIYIFPLLLAHHHHQYHYYYYYYYYFI